MHLTVPHHHHLLFCHLMAHHHRHYHSFLQQKKHHQLRDPPDSPREEAMTQMSFTEELSCPMCVEASEWQRCTNKTNFAVHVGVWKFQAGHC